MGLDGGNQDGNESQVAYSVDLEKKGRKKGSKETRKEKWRQDNRIKDNKRVRCFELIDFYSLSSLFDPFIKPSNCEAPL